jgi:pimeloyl-ACP methyl ester carboxylesterase/DNA-binding CsgD family transcriptional regulator
MESTPVQYVTTSDGYNIAYSVGGNGEPLVFLPLGFNHVQLSWRHDSRISTWLDLLAAWFRLIRYDSRGQGMSTHGLKDSYSVRDLETDLAAVIDRADAGPVTLLGYFYSAHVALRYAVQHPERVKALVLVTCSVSMSVWPMSNLVGLGEQNWNALLQNWVPSTYSAEERERLVAFWKQILDQDDWFRSARAFGASDVGDILRDVTTPTLVLHPKDFLWLKPEESMKVAAQIPNARFSLIDGDLPLGNPLQGVQAIQEFLKGLDASSPQMALEEGHRDSLSSREVEVLRLLAGGRSNQQIADELVISLNTVRRHVSNIFDKTGAANRADAVSYAHRKGMV